MSNSSRSTRRRKNATLTLAKSDPSNVDQRTLPRLPSRDGGWHAEVSRWWKAVWSSQYCELALDGSDRISMLSLADLLQRRFETESDDMSVKLGGEIRQAQHALGLTPRSRQQSKIELSRVGEAEDRRAKRRRSKAASEANIGGDTLHAEALSKDEMLDRIQAVK